MGGTGQPAEVNSYCVQAYCVQALFEALSVVSMVDQWWFLIYKPVMK